MYIVGIVELGTSLVPKLKRSRRRSGEPLTKLGWNCWVGFPVTKYETCASENVPATARAELKTNKDTS